MPADQTHFKFSDLVHFRTPDTFLWENLNPDQTFFKPLSLDDATICKSHSVEKDSEAHPVFKLGGVGMLSDSVVSDSFQA